MNMGKVKQRFPGVFLAMVSVLFVCGSAAAEFEVTTPVPMVDLNGDGVGDPVLGVRITAFSNADTSSNELIVGVPPLHDGANDFTKNSIEDWRYSLEQGCNRLNVVYSSETLTLKIGHGTSCDDINHWHEVSYGNISSSLSGDRLAAFLAAFNGGLNVVQINIASLDSGTNIVLKGLEWEGVWNFNDFYSDGQNSRSWSLTGNYGTSIFIHPYSSISLVCNLELGGDFSLSSSYVELLFGKFTPPNQPPDCINVSPSVNTLWPPSGEFWEVGISVSDPDGDPVAVSVTGIRQDEPVCDSALPCRADAEIVNGQAKLRAKRNPVGNGRVYTIDFTAADGRNGTCAGQVVVGVPKNKGKNGVPVDDGPRCNSLSTAACP